jgi:hypothetical protein
MASSNLEVLVIPVQKIPRWFLAFTMAHGKQPTLFVRFNRVLAIRARQVGSEVLVGGRWFHVEHRVRAHH